MTLVFVAIGGACGSISRFKLGKYISEKSSSRFPFGTFVVNILGAFFLGIVSNLGLGQTGYALFGDGFLGAFTTFSTFMYDGFSLFEDRERLNGVTYIGLSVLLGFIAYGIGKMVALAIIG